MLEDILGYRQYFLSFFCPKYVCDNDEVLERNEENPVLLPRFSCHSLRHTFTTRMCEAGVNIKVIQDALGHSDISTTLNIYADVTKELKKKEFEGLEAVFHSGTV
jgi:integrase